MEIRFCVYFLIPILCVADAYPQEQYIKEVIIELNPQEAAILEGDSGSSLEKMMTMRYVMAQMMQAAIGMMGSGQNNAQDFWPEIDTATDMETMAETSASAMTPEQGSLPVVIPPQRETMMRPAMMAAGSTTMDAGVGLGQTSMTLPGAAMSITDAQITSSQQPLDGGSLQQTQQQTQDGQREVESQESAEDVGMAPHMRRPLPYFPGHAILPGTFIPHYFRPFGFLRRGEDSTPTADTAAAEDEGSTTENEGSANGGNVEDEQEQSDPSESSMPSINPMGMTGNDMATGGSSPSANGQSFSVSSMLPLTGVMSSFCYDGNRKADPTDTTYYLWCVNNQYRRTKCAPGTIFCVSINNCCIEGVDNRQGMSQTSGSTLGSGGMSSSMTSSMDSSISGYGEMMQVSSGNSGGMTVNGGSTAFSVGSVADNGGSTTVNGGSTTVNGGSMAFNGESTTVNGGSMTVAGGNMAVAGGSTAVNGGNMAVNGGSTAVNGGNMAVNGGSMAVNGGNMQVNGGNMPVNGGNMPFNGGSMTVNGGMPGFSDALTSEQASSNGVSQTEESSMTHSPLAESKNMNPGDPNNGDSIPMNGIFGAGEHVVSGYGYQLPAAMMGAVMNGGVNGINSVQNPPQVNVFNNGMMTVDRFPSPNMLAQMMAAMMRSQQEQALNGEEVQDPIDAMPISVAPAQVTEVQEPEIPVVEPEENMPGPMATQEDPRAMAPETEPVALSDDEAPEQQQTADTSDQEMMQDFDYPDSVEVGNKQFYPYPYPRNIKLNVRVWKK